MFDLDRWAEIGQILNQHKLRTLLTALGVSWGVFMLVVLLGMGKGLERGIMYIFRDTVANAVWIEGSKTSMPFQGLAPGRAVHLDIDDIEMLKRMPGVATVAPSKTLQGGYTMQYRQRTGAFNVNGITAVTAQITKMALEKGRELNELDDREGRKVAVIGKRVAEVLFGPDQDPIGESVLVGGIPFQVVGVYKRTVAEQVPNRFYIPFRTLRNTFDPSPSVSLICLTTAPGYSWQGIKPEVVRLLAGRHRFAPADAAALNPFDVSEEVRKVQTLLTGIRVFMIIVGVGTLLAGCIGVSNTMLVTVKERTREIGVRKAVGATPRTIIAMILQETLAITLFAGYVGLSAGTGLVEFIRRNGAESEFFRDPQVDLGVALGAFAVLILAGLIAGYLPARQAVKIQPIEALRHE